MTWIESLQSIITQSVAFGWHERNAGNISIRLDSTMLEGFELSPSTEWLPLGVRLTTLTNTTFFITGTGVHFRNIPSNLQEGSCILETNETGDMYRILWGSSLPSSELPTHLLCHDANVDKGHRVIMHAHTTHLIALTYVLDLDSDTFTRHLWEMNTECPVVFPQGVGVLEWMVPGTLEIGRATQALMKDYNAVIWAHHGVFCSGPSLDDTFGLMETLEKSAEVLVKVISMGGKKNIIKQTQLDATADRFKVTLRTIK